MYEDNQNVFTDVSICSTSVSCNLIPYHYCYLYSSTSHFISFSNDKLSRKWHVSYFIDYLTNCILKFNFLVIQMEDDAISRFCSRILFLYLYIVQCFSFLVSVGDEKKIENLLYCAVRCCKRIEWKI